jgi:hypothetical protein
MSFKDRLKYLDNIDFFESMPPRKRGRRPPVDKGRAMALLFRGYSAHGVGKELKCSHVAVLNIRDHFVSEAEEGGIMAAAEKYGVKEQVQALMEISAAVEETKVDASRAPLGLRIVKAVEGFGVDAEGAPAFIDACYAEASRQGLEPAGFVKAVAGLYNLQIKDGKDYLDLLASVEELNQRFEELDDKTYEYEQKAAAAEAEMKNAINNKDATKLELDQFVALRDALAPYKIDLKDVEKAKNCIVNISKSVNEPEALVTFYSEGMDLEERKKAAEDRLGSVSTEELKVGNKLRKATEELKAKDEMVRRLRDAETLKVMPSQFSEFVEKAREVGARHGLSSVESLNRLVTDLSENWEPKLGFENDVTRLKSIFSNLEEKVKLAQEREHVALESARAQEAALKGLSELRKHVSPAEIADFKKIIVESGCDVSAFRSDIERLGDATAVVEKIIVEKKAAVAELEAEKTNLEVRVQDLRKEEETLKSYLAYNHSQVVASLNNARTSIISAALALEKDFTNPDTGYSATIRKLGDESKDFMETEFKAHRETLRKQLDTTEKTFNIFLRDMEKLKTDSWETGKAIGLNTHLIRIASIVGEKPVEKVDAVATISMAVNAFNVYFKKQGLDYPSGDKFGEELLQIWRLKN